MLRVRVHIPASLCVYVESSSTHPRFPPCLRRKKSSTHPCVLCLCREFEYLSLLPCVFMLRVEVTHPRFALCLCQEFEYSSLCLCREFQYASLLPSVFASRKFECASLLPVFVSRLRVLIPAFQPAVSSVAKRTLSVR